MVHTEAEAPLALSGYHQRGDLRAITAVELGQDVAYVGVDGALGNE